MPERISSGLENWSRRSETPLAAGTKIRGLVAKRDAAALRAELHGLHLHDEQTVIVGLEAGLRLAFGHAGLEAADELQPEDAAVVEAVPGGGHLLLHHGRDEGVDARAGVEAVIAGGGDADHGHGMAVEQDGLIEDRRDCR